MSRLEQIIRNANSRGRVALVPFLTAGFPDKESFWDILEELAASGADIIEIGVPFSDPVADGPVVENASRAALEQGVSLQWILDGLSRRAIQPETGLVLMGYYNPFLRYGLARLAEDAAKCGVNGFIVPDLPYEEQTAMREALAAWGIDLVPLVGPNTSGERMRLYAREASGYVYVVSVLGITGERDNIPPIIAESLERARKNFSLPVALGFGLKNPAQLEGLPRKPDAAVFGSALLKHIGQGGSAREFMDVWK